jgi:uncharacterized membrane protein
MIGDARIPGRVLTAPMTGISDLPYRRATSRLGAAYVATEMVACEAFTRAIRVIAIAAVAPNQQPSACFLLPWVKMENAAAPTPRQQLQLAEQRLLDELLRIRRTLRHAPHTAEAADRLTIGQRIADQVATTMGSWRFIIIQSAMLFLWVVLNVTAYVQRWDPYPFILLNLALSFQAAYAAPFIMMSQNRQQDIDRKKAESDYNINVKAELEIELLHHKIDELREKEVLSLLQAIERLTAALPATNAAANA